ncbi:hypothetical protein ABR33_16130 [Enterobacter bugandensis]|nr:hypothetical protein ABR33_16130 [Enterobacter bugandensis]
MRKARFTEHQIIAVLKPVETGRTVKDICRETGISEASYYIYGEQVTPTEPIFHLPVCVIKI